MPDLDPVIPGAAGLRPMPFTTLDIGRLVDPIFEPLWAGRRALARGALRRGGDGCGIGRRVDPRDPPSAGSPSKSVTY